MHVGDTIGYTLPGRTEGDTRWWCEAVIQQLHPLGLVMTRGLSSPKPGPDTRVSIRRYKNGTIPVSFRGWDWKKFEKVKGEKPLNVETINEKNKKIYKQTNAKIGEAARAYSAAGASSKRKRFNTGAAAGSSLSSSAGSSSSSSKRKTSQSAATSKAYKPFNLGFYIIRHFNERSFSRVSTLIEITSHTESGERVEVKAEIRDITGESYENTFKRLKYDWNLNTPAQTETIRIQQEKPNGTWFFRFKATAKHSEGLVYEQDFFAHPSGYNDRDVQKVFKKVIASPASIHVDVQPAVRGAHSAAAPAPQPAASSSSSTPSSSSSSSSSSSLQLDQPLNEPFNVSSSQNLQPSGAAAAAPRKPASRRHSPKVCWKADQAKAS